jgi:hypothetical protein
MKQRAGRSLFRSWARSLRLAKLFVLAIVVTTPALISFNTVTATGAGAAESSVIHVTTSVGPSCFEVSGIEYGGIDSGHVTVKVKYRKQFHCPLNGYISIQHNSPSAPDKWVSVADDIYVLPTNGSKYWENRIGALVPNAATKFRVQVEYSYKDYYSPETTIQTEKAPITFEWTWAEDGPNIAVKWSTPYFAKMSLSFQIKGASLANDHGWQNSGACERAASCYGGGIVINPGTNTYSATVLRGSYTYTHLQSYTSYDVRLEAKDPAFGVAYSPVLNTRTFR